MPTHSELWTQLDDTQVEIDELRLEWMRKLSAYTGRPLVVYHANDRSGGYEAQVNEDDVYALMETLKGIKGPSLDLMIHSNGGSPYGADMFIAYVQDKFTDLRVIVPKEALSAATMIACGASKLLMASHSFLGPIDAQIPVADEYVGAQELLDQYDLIREDFVGNRRAFWDGPGRRYFPALVVQCRNSLAYGKLVANRALSNGAFRGMKRVGSRAQAVADDLANNAKHKAHGRRLSREYVSKLGLPVEKLEANGELQDLVLSVHHCFRITFALRPELAKVVQNHQGRVHLSYDVDGIAGEEGEEAEEAGEEGEEAEEAGEEGEEEGEDGEE